MPEVTTKKPPFSSKQEALNFLYPSRPVFRTRVEAMNFLNQSDSSGIVTDKPVPKATTTQVPKLSSQPGNLSQQPPLSPGSSFAAPVSTAVDLGSIDPRIVDRPQLQADAGQKIQRSQEEKKQFFAQRAAAVIEDDLNKLTSFQASKSARGRSQTTTAALAVLHGAFPIIANKSPIAQKEKEELKKKFPITFSSGELLGEALPITASFEATRFALKPVAKAMTKALAKSSEAKKLAASLGLKATEGAIAGSLFEALSGNKPTPETAAMFAAFEVAIPGIQAIFKGASKKAVQAKTQAEFAKVATDINKEIKSLRRISGKSQLKSIEQRDAGLQELADASKAERDITLQAETIKRGRANLQNARAELDKLNAQTVTSKEGKNVTARARNIVENLKKDKSLRQSKLGRDLLRQSLKLQESIGNLQKKAKPEVKVIPREGKPPVVTGEKQLSAEARTQTEVEKFGKANNLLTTEQTIEPTKVGILDKAISDFAENKIKQGELIAKFNDAVVKKEAKRVLPETKATKAGKTETKVKAKKSLPEKQIVQTKKRTGNVFDEAPNISRASIEAKKQSDGKFKLFFRGTRNEVFEGEVFESAAEANNFFQAEKVKAQTKRPKPTPVKGGKSQENLEERVGGRSDSGARPRLSRQEVEQQVRDLRLPKEQTDAQLQVFDARAKAWSKQTGRSADEWFGEHIAGIKRSSEKNVNGQNILKQDSNPVFYSKLQHTIETKMPNAADVQTLRGIAKNVKKEEMKWTGLDDFLAERKGKITKKEVLDFLDENQIRLEETVKGGITSRTFEELQPEIERLTREAQRAQARGERDEARRLFGEAERLTEESEATELFGGLDDTKFAVFQLPGGKDYREMLLRLPVVKGKLDLSLVSSAKRDFSGNWTINFTDGSSEIIFFGDASTKKSAIELAIIKVKNKFTGGPTPKIFRSQHFDEPNVLAHVRFNVRIDRDGKKVLFLEEIQTDWIKEGKRKGFARSPLTELPPSAKIKKKPKPPEPFRDNRYTVEFEGRVVDFSADSGEQIKSKALSAINSQIITTGVPDVPFKSTWHEMTMRRMVRYAADNGFDRIGWTTGKQQVDRYEEALRSAVDKIKWTKTDKGVQIVGFKDGNKVVDTFEKENSVSDAIGKSMAETIGNSPNQSGVFKGTDIKIDNTGMADFYDKIVVNYANKFGKKFGSRVTDTQINTGRLRTDETFVRSGVEKIDFPGGEKVTVHALDITPEMKKTALTEGFPLFQDAKGAVEFLEGEQRAIIHLFKSADVSTLAHETGHIFRRELSGADLATAEKWAGVKGGNWTTQAEEKFARGFEKFLSEGKSPNNALKKIFQQFKEWLTGIYGEIKGSDIDVELSPEIRKVFDRLLGEKPARPKPTPVKGGKPQENLDLGVQATIPKGKIKTVQGKKTGLFAPKIKGKQGKIAFQAGDPLDNVLNQGIRLREGDRIKGVLSDEMKALQSRFKNKRIFNKSGQALDEHATNLGISEEQLRQQLLKHDLPTVRVRELKKQEAFFLENNKAGIEAEKKFKKAGEPKINEKGELVVSGRVLFSISGGVAGLENDEEGRPTFNANKALAGILATSVGVNILRSQRLRRLGTNLVERIQNSQLRVRQLQELKGVKLQGKGLDPFEAEIRFHGRIDHRLRKVKNAAEKIDKGIAQVEKRFAKNFPLHANRDFQQDTFLYLISKHAPEYNATLGKNAAGITTSQANATLLKLKNLPYFGEIKRIASQIKKLSDATLDILADGQIISQEVKDDLRKRWPEYISFQRVLEDADNTQLMQILSGGKGISVIGTGLKKAKGSNLEIADILTNSVANVEQAYVRAEKNAVALSTLEFARNNKHLGLFKELKLGKASKIEKAKGFIEEVLPFDVSARTGKPIFNTQKLFNDKNIIGIREKGKQVFLKVADPSLASALKMTGQKSLGTVTRAVGAFTRYITATATRFNPAFQIPNLLRDTQEMAVFLTAQKEFGVSGAARTTKRILGSMKDIYDAVFWGKDTPGTRIFKQMQADGGTTGGLSLSTRKNLEIDIAKIRKANRSHPRKVVKEVEKFFDNYNSLFEDATRLSVYKESLARGLTRKEAAVFAKEATINFNRRGTIGSHMNSWYAFANASIQGSTKMIRAMRKSPKAAAAVTSAVLAATWGQNQLNDMVDPDWRDKVPQWERNNNLVILMPGAKNGRYERILIPVSWGIKPIKTLADYTVDLAQGHKRGSKLDIVTGIAGSALDAYNPVGGSNWKQAITPTILDVPLDIAANKTWFGKPIKKENIYRQNLPESDKYFRSTRDTKVGQFLINTTGYLNDKTNGVVSVSPETIKYTIEQYAGGSGRFIARSYDSIIKIGSGKVQDINEIPIVRRFFKSTPDDVIEKWQKAKKLNDPSFKRLEQQAAHQEFQKSMWVRDAFEQIKESRSKQEKLQIVRELINKDPNAYKKLVRRLKDDRKGIDYFDSALKDLPPNFRAERVMIELKRAKDKKARLRELIKARIIDKETAFHLKKLGFKKPE